MISFSKSSASSTLASLLCCACGLGEVGADHDAYAAAQAAKRAGLDTVDTTEEETSEDSPGRRQTETQEIAGEGEQSGDDGFLDDADPDGSSPFDLATVDVGSQCKSVDDCAAGAGPCVKRECENGKCVYPPVTCPPPVGDDCDINECDPATGECKFGGKPDGTACDDGISCTSASECKGQACVSTVVDCDDGDACTDEKCTSADGCKSTPKSAALCDDANACTTDKCEPKSGCAYTNLTAQEPCSDDNVCTVGDACLAGKCKIELPQPCEASTVCSTLTCDAKLGCAIPPVLASTGTLCAAGGYGCVAGECSKLWATGLAVGPSHACALQFGGTLACWGSNSTLAIGGAALADQITPTVVVPDGVVQVAVGTGFTCYIVASGAVMCRGKNDHGQVGAIPGSPVENPEEVTPLASATLIAAGENHACAQAGPAGAEKVYCWGAGTNGQLGKTDVVTDQFSPVQVAGLGKVQALAAGGGNTCALVDGVPYCWGSDALQWANPKASPKKGTPSPVLDVDGLQSFVVGTQHACGLSASKLPICWGSNSLGQLGTPANAGQIAVVKPTFPNVIGQSAATGHSCLVLSGTGAVVCFGSWAQGQLGEGNFSTPATVIAGGAVVVSSAGYATCARMADGSVSCFGAGPNGTPLPDFTVPGSGPVPK